MSKNPPEKKDGAGEPTQEPRLADRLQISVEELVDLRNTTLADADFYEKSGRIYYRPTGVAKIEAAVAELRKAETDRDVAVSAEISEEGAESAEKEGAHPNPSDEKKDALAAQGARQFEVVKRMPNLRLLSCRVVAPQNGEERIVLVRVRDNRLLRPGQIITALQPDPGSHVWRSVPGRRRMRRG